MKKAFLFASMSCIIAFGLLTSQVAVGQSSTGARVTTSLNGQWNVIIDPFDVGIGNWKPIWKDLQPAGKTDFYEYRFDPAVTLNVPGDWNSQSEKLLYYESTVWYKKTFTYHLQPGKRLFIQFDGANYETDVFVNTKKAGSHEGGFTAFGFEITNLVSDGENSVIVRVNNRRHPDAIPAMRFDWWNYGGITRDVTLVETPATFVNDHFIQLKKGSSTRIEGWVSLDGIKTNKTVTVSIPDLKINYQTKTNEQGRAEVGINARPDLWSPENPRLYKVIINTDADSLVDQIGFRNIDVKGPDIFLNGKSIFLRGVNIHEEIPQRAGRANSEADARLLLQWAKDLGCNFVRLTHYPHSAHMLKLADEMGILIWEEIPLWQGIAFSDSTILSKANRFLDEMIARDKNRCAIILWSLSNETSPSPDRDRVLAAMARHARSLDPTRLITSALFQVPMKGHSATIVDTLSRSLDVIAVNQYLGWYQPWPAAPEDMVWTSHFDKPLIMSEFGGEALQGHHGSADTASNWTEEYQEKIYRDQLTMMRNIPFLRGMCPWVLADFRSPSRMHPVYQQGWNRKGLLGSNGRPKKAWFIMHAYYEQQKLKYK